MKLVRALVAAVAALVVGVTVQVGTSSSASAAGTVQQSTDCFTCWGVAGD